LLDCGQCELDGEPLLFVVMEYAEESLSQILPYRALAPDEVQELLIPTLDALAFLHNEKWIQGQLKPSNFLVVDDQLKLAVDTIRPIGVSQMGPRRPSIYDAPESDDGLVSVGSDIWALGVTMTEALTQYPPTWLGGRSDPPTFPTNLPAEFADTIQRCLSVKADDRPTVADLQVRTRPGETQRPSAAPQATATQRTSTPRTQRPPAPASSASPSLAMTSPPSQPLSPQPVTGSPPVTASQPVTAPPLGQAPQSSVARPEIVIPPAPAPALPPPIPVPEMPMRADRPYSEVAAKQKRGAFVPMLFALVVVGGAIWVGTKLLGRHVELPPATVSKERAAPDQNTSGTSAALNQRAPQNPSGAAGDAGVGASTTPKQDTSPRRVGSAAAPAPNAMARANTSPTQPRSSSSGSESAGPGSAAVHEEIPNVSARSRSTIRGHVRVAVKVTVDGSGRVIHDVLDNASSSNYFNRVASEAARKWRFATADRGTREWVLRFEFGREGTTVKAVGPRS